MSASTDRASGPDEHPGAIARGEVRVRRALLSVSDKRGVVDFALDSLTIEITGGEEKVDRLLEVLRPYGILEMVRTGIVAMRRGTKSEEQAAAAAAEASGNGAATVSADDNVSYSV